MLFRKFRSAAVALVFFATFGAWADQVVLERGLNGYDGVSDNSMFENLPSNTAGGAPHTFSGNTFTGPETGRRRALMRFDLTGEIPAGSTIESVELRLVIDKSGNGARSNDFYHLNRLTSSWGEGARFSPVSGGGLGAPAEEGDATWSSGHFIVNLWNTPGGDFLTTASVSMGLPVFDPTPPALPIPQTFSGAGLVEDVQAWLDDPPSNFGWLLRGLESPVIQFNARRFVSSEGLAQENRPRLTITFTAPPNAAADWNLYR